MLDSWTLQKKLLLEEIKNESPILFYSIIINNSSTLQHYQHNNIHQDTF